MLALAVVVAVQWLVGWAEIWAAWRGVPPQLLALGGGLALLSYSLRAIRLATVAGGLEARATPLSWFRITALHLAAINLVPARAGEAALPLLMRRHCDVPLGRGVALLVAIRLHDLVAMATLGLAALTWLLYGPALAALVLAALAAAGWAGLAVAPRVLLPWAAGGAAWLRAVSWPLRLLPSRLGRVYLLTLAAWSAKWLSLAVIAGAVAGLEPLQALVAIGAAEIAALSPIQGVAGAGTFEAAVAAALAFTGLDAAAALHAAVVLHLFLLGVSVLLGAVAALLPHRGVRSSPSESSL
ncbi:putative membrane protein [Thioalkalivibrio nitratireducens DSM 14787]|uniref:Membrane protein n=1 Tax=Thioalkalivibrio nitratireducens (strain DSM 14787 / UNIQEM 213 / ALEN2) TaxID=1255043 RepID=L0E1U1_THIND|nr:lysylphosphatidylglycerol synthase domain-containing protein [Thioalkalivibrio nitratireducens]AGA35175.1 putative membrane protein [Thioalkalivibrio nitratireducens DSM 14787]